MIRLSRLRIRGHRARRAVAVAAVVLAVATTLVIAPTSADAAGGPHARTAAEKSMLLKVLKQLNAERKAHHVPALRNNLQLANSARLHDYRMSTKQAMSHQLPGETSLGRRITAAGYKWSRAAENIGWTSPRTTKRVLALISAMYNERPPNDGHRVNILSRSYTDAGVDIYGDASHNRIWLTVDFGHH